MISAAPSGSAAELETLIAQGLRERELDRPLAAPWARA